MHSLHAQFTCFETPHEHDFDQNHDKLSCGRVYHYMKMRCILSARSHLLLFGLIIILSATVASRMGASLMRQRGSRNNPLTAAGSINFRSLRSTGPDFTRTLLQLPPSYIHICSTTSIRRYVAQVLRNIIRRNTVMERHRRRQRHPKPNWSAILVANTPPREAAIHSFGTGCVHLSQPASLRRHPRR